MTLVFAILGALLLFAIYRIIRVKQQNRLLNEQRFEREKKLYDQLEKGAIVTTTDVLPFAANLLTRETTYRLLSDYNKTDLFPRDYYSIVKGAESNLANWLEFPTELDACPDEMEHIKRVSIDFDGNKNMVYYEVFKYRTNEPHWAAKNGWMLGVVGPFFDDSKPYDFPGSTFSRCDSTVDKITPEEEAKWVHENISNRR
jgi:hypothetical protein